MKTQKLEIPEGHMFDRVDVQSKEIIYKEIPPLTVFDRIKTLADVLADNGFTQESFDKHCEGLPEDEVGYRLAKLLSKSMNEDWIADWNNANQPKYQIWWDMRSGSSGFRFGGYGNRGSYSGVGSRLCLRSPQVCKHIGDHPELTAIWRKFAL